MKFRWVSVGLYVLINSSPRSSIAAHTPGSGLCLVVG